MGEDEQEIYQRTSDETKKRERKSTSSWRSGFGALTSRTGSKESGPGRTISANHEGRTGTRNTEEVAEVRIDKGFRSNEVTETEWQILKEDYGSAIRELQTRTNEDGSKWTREQIRDYIDRNYQ